MTTTEWLQQTRRRRIAEINLNATVASLETVLTAHGIALPVRPQPSFDRSRLTEYHADLTQLLSDHGLVVSV